jgi:hypothetical protein|tara:strand:- start:2559 stop:2780 length:222 start_codon:yes stop_codon:yes gene_type:complete
MTNKEKEKWRAQLIKVEQSSLGTWFLALPHEFVDTVKWPAGTMLDIIDNETGSYTLKTAPRNVWHKDALEKND